MADMGALLNTHFRRATRRAPTNPLDKSTIVSIFPKTVYWKNNFVQPGEYVIPEGFPENPTIFIVSPSSGWKDVGPEQPLMEIPYNSMIMAKSIIDEFSDGIMEAARDRKPGLFFVPGCKYGPNNEPSEALTKAWIIKEYQNLITQARERQESWFLALVNQADTDWARTSGNPNSVNDLSRMAALQMGLRDSKPWMVNFKAAELKPCIACGNLINYSFPVCQHCHHVINPEAYKKLGLQKAV